jgi:Ras-related protein Rab-1A
MNRDFDVDGIIKILVLGNSNVGKTSLISRYSNNEYNDIYSATIGVDLNLKIITHGITDKKLKLQLWDATGLEKFQSIVKCYYKGTDGFIVMYDVTDRKSFDHINDWLNEIYNKNANSHVKILVANKTDLHTCREVLYEEGKELADMYNIDFFEISAKNNTNIDRMFDDFIKNIVANTNYNKRKTTPKENKTENKSIISSFWDCCCYRRR